LIQFFDCSSLKEEIETAAKPMLKVEPPPEKHKHELPESKLNGNPAQDPTQVEVIRK